MQEIYSRVVGAGQDRGGRTFENMNGDAGIFCIGRGTRVVASVTYCCIVHCEDAGLVSMGRDIYSVVRVIIYHPCVMVPAEEEEDEEEER